MNLMMEINKNEDNTILDQVKDPRKVANPKPIMEQSNMLIVYIGGMQW